MFSQASAIPGAEFLNPGDTDRIQRERWKSQIEYVQQRSDFYRRHFSSSTLSDDIDSLSDLPFTDKEMLRRDQSTNPPFGTYLAGSPDDIARIHRTSGTTGTAMNLALSHHDTVMTAQIGARAQAAAGLGPGHRVVHCLNYQLWMGGYTDHAALEATGASVVPYGVGNSKGLIRTIQELGITAISCTPSYPAALEQVIASEFTELQPRDLGLQLGLFGGEPGLDDPVFRDRLENTWGFKARNANYGVTDVLCNFAGQSELCDDLHFVALDVLYPELIDPASGSRKPWHAGESGELVLTHLAKQCQPLVRFRCGDVIQITDTGVAACGRTAPRFRVIGRSDDMIVVRGLNIFPAMIAAVVNRFDDLSGEYCITLENKPPYDFLPVTVEMNRMQSPPEGLDLRIESAIKEQLGARARVNVLPLGSLPRTEGKSRRVIRNYQQ